MSKEWGGHALNNEDLAALLDGEVRDLARAEELSSLIAADSNLLAEYEEQRSIKTLLGQLEEFEAPQLMTEHVLAGIAASRGSEAAGRYAVDAAELAGLLDGELVAARADGLSERVNTDSGLMAAFEEQRLVKRALGQLPEFEEPHYLATQVLARIEAQRSRRRGTVLTKLRLAMGGAMLFVGGFLAALQFMQPSIHGGAAIAERGMPAPLLALPAGLTHSTDDMFSRLPNSSRLLSDEELAQLDPRAVAYLETLEQAHSYSLIKSINSSQSPELSGAIMVLDQGGQ